MFCFLQIVGTENCYEYFSKEAGNVGRDVKAQNVCQQFPIYHDQLQSSLPAADHSTTVSDHEEMELHPSVTAEFVPETFAARNEIFDDINNTG